MAESSTRNFVSQWAYDHGQSREDVRVETTMQWLGVDRVAEQVRQRQETHVESEFDAMDFETRAAALEAHFFQPWSTSQRSPQARVVRIRPQSASVARRAAENDAVGGSNKRTRPQSAKTRSDNASSTTQTESQVQWKAPAQQQASKWREMLARGPEFKQLTLRRLELETYELLYNTLQQPQVVKPKSTTRRRKRRTSGSGASTQSCRPEGDSPVLACGSGLHLARSRKKRQQEHDRQMMSGKGRQPSRSNELDRGKGATDDKRAIQDKTRQRSKLLKKKKSLKQLQGQSKPDSKQEPQQSEPVLQRQPNAQRTARGPWIPAGSASSLSIRGISSNANEMEVPQDTRVAEAVDAFRSHAHTHLRLSKHVQKQLKKAQQSAKTSREAKGRKSDKISIESTKCARPWSASSSKNVNADSRDCNNNQASQNDTAKAGTSLLVAPEPSPLESGSESLFSESPATLTLVIPPLKLAPHSWEDQDTSDAHHIISALSQGSNADLHSATLSTASRHEPREQSTPQAEPTDTEARETAVKVEANLKMNDEVGLDMIPVPERWICTETGIQRPAGDSNPDRPAENTQQEASIFEQNQENARRFASIEDGYLAEDGVEKGSTGASTEVDESSPTQLEPHFAATEVTPLLESRLVDPVSDVRLPTAACLHEDRVSSGAVEAHGAGGDRTVVQVETPLSRTKEIDTELSGEVNSARSAAEIEATTHSATSKAVEAGKLDEISESNKTNAEQPSSLENYTDGSSPDAIETGGLDDRPEPVGILDLATESLHDAIQDDAQDLVEENIRNECRQSGDPPEATATIVDKDTNFTTMAAVASQRPEDDQSNSPLVGLPSVNALLSDGVKEVRSTSPKEYPEDSCVHNDTAQVMDLGTSTLQTHSLEIEEPIQGTLDSDPAPDRSEVTHHASGEPVGKLEPHGGLGNALPSVGDQNFSDTGDHQAAQYEKGRSSNPPRSQSPNVELLATVPTSQPASVRTPSIEDEGKSLLPVVGSDRTPTNPFNSDARNEPRSPKKKSRKSVKTLSSKKRKNSVAHSQVAASNTDPTTITASLSTPSSSPKAKDGSSDRSEEDPLRSQKQSVTRSFLTRVASGKTMLPESSSVQPQPQSRKELVEQHDTFGITAESTAAGMDVDTQQKQSAVKEQEDVDGEPASLEVNDCQSNVEKHPCEDSSPPTTTERIDMAPSFASVSDSSRLTSAVTNTDASDQAPPEPEPIARSASEDVELSEQEPPLSTADDVASRSDLDANGHELMHNAACKIQAQYRCFVRRRLILDQLRFMVAKQRRQARRKSRQKGKKVVAGDAAGMASESSSPIVAADEDRPQQEVQQVAPTLTNSENAVEVPSEASPCEAPEPFAEDEKLAARKGSCEYAFELFDGAKEAGKRKADLVEATGEPTTTRLERLDVQQDPAALPEKDVAVAASGANAATSSELVQGEDQASEADAAPLPEVEQVQEQPALPATGGGFLTPTLLAELAFSDVVEDDPTATIAEAAEPPSRWERYVDSSTSKSYYFNPITNKTQWTAPEDRDDAAVNSSRATLSTPRAAADAAGTWQEFLDEASGQVYYFNDKTGECSWELPAASAGVVVSPQSTAPAERAATSASAWIMYIDPASQAPYYVNVETLATSWEQPDGFSTVEPAAAREDAYVIAVDDHATLDLEI